jgi:hypothetical protein
MGGFNEDALQEGVMWMHCLDGVMMIDRRNVIR